VRPGADEALTEAETFPDAACRVISPVPGVGEPSLDSDSGVIIPDMPTWFGDAGALRLMVEVNGVLKQATPLCLRLLNA